jgi:tight adherence protein C
MPIPPEQLRLSATTLLALGLGVGGYRLARIAPLPRPALGHRGLQRARALAGVHGFFVIEPPMRWLAALIAELPLREARSPLDRMLVRAGDFLGLCADEWLALSAISAAIFALVAASTAARFGLGYGPVAAATALGSALPFLSMDGERVRRQQRIQRGLPPAIDLLALCMGAGLDFAGALELYTSELNDEHDPLTHECKRVLEELSLGHTRRQALVNLAERVPCTGIVDFTTAVIQAEQKGNPLAEVLAIQARMTRMRRSVAAEEAAARAGVMLVLPMTLLLAAVVLVMVGPFIVNGFGL